MDGVVIVGIVFCSLWCEYRYVCSWVRVDCLVICWVVLVFVWWCWRRSVFWLWLIGCDWVVLLVLWYFVRLLLVVVWWVCWYVGFVCRVGWYRLVIRVCWFGCVGWIFVWFGCVLIWWLFCFVLGCYFFCRLGIWLGWLLFVGICCWWFLGFFVWNWWCWWFWCSCWVVYVLKFVCRVGWCGILVGCLGLWIVSGG